MQSLLCSMCFNDHGLRLDAERLGALSNERCEQCGNTNGRKLNEDALNDLVYRFFVHGSVFRARYGAAPQIQVNDRRETDINPSSWLEPDIRLLERTRGLGFFHYGPRMWTLGEVEPLHRLIRKVTRNAVFDEIIAKYPTRTLHQSDRFYRVRKDPAEPDNPAEYDSAPVMYTGAGRLDAKAARVMYASPDLQVCVHECRVTVEDTLFVATLRSVRELRLLDLTVHPKDDNLSEFESLGIAIHFLFFASKHSYPITRDLATRLTASGFDGVVYPSYFSILRTGHLPWERARAEPPRRLPELGVLQPTDTVQNIALFGSPLADRKVEIECINRLILNRVQYDFSFGPVQV